MGSFFDDQTEKRRKMEEGEKALLCGGDGETLQTVSCVRDQKEKVMMITASQWTTR